MAFAPIAPAGAAVLQHHVVGGRASGAWDYPLSSQEKNWRLLALFQHEIDDLQDENAELQFDADHWEDRCAKLMALSKPNSAFSPPTKADEGLTYPCEPDANSSRHSDDAGDACDADDAGDLKAPAKTHDEVDKKKRPTPAEASMQRLRLSQSACSSAGEMPTSQSARRQRRAMRREPFKALDWHRNWSSTYESIASDARAAALRIEAARIAGAAQTHVADLGEAATAHAQDLGEAVHAHAKDLGDSAEQLGAELADKAQALGESLAQFWGESSFAFPSGAKDSAKDGDLGSKGSASSSRRRRASWALGDLFGATQAETPKDLEIAESWAVANSPAVDALWPADPCPDAKTPGSPCME